MKRLVMSAVMVCGLMLGSAMAQGEAAAGAAAGAADGAKIEAAADAAPAKKAGGTGFWAVILGSGPLGVLLWLALFGCGAAAIYFSVDSFVLIRPQKIMPQTLI